MENIDMNLTKLSVFFIYYFVFATLIFSATVSAPFGPGLLFLS